MRSLKFIFFKFIFGVTLLLGCTTLHSPSFYEGIQPEFVGTNVGLIAFFPLIPHLNPTKRTSIDLAVLNSEGVAGIIEQMILTSFQNQPKVNGISPSAVKKLLGASPEVLKNIEDIFKNSEHIQTENSLCTNSSSYVEWYVNCFSTYKPWQHHLLEFAKKAKDANAILFVTLNGIDKARKKVLGYEIHAEVSVLLVSTATGKLIWGRSASDSVSSGPTQSGFPAWEILFARIFSEPFWLDFPGRIAPVLPK